MSNKNTDPETLETFEPAEIFENEIETCLDQFCREKKIDDLRGASQGVWNGAMIYIGNKLFKGTNRLKFQGRYDINNNKIKSNCNQYDYNLVNGICDIYIYLCCLYDKEISILGFSKLTGIDYYTLMLWGDNNNKLWGNSNSVSSGNNDKLSITGFDIYKKLHLNREESLSNKLATGNKNPVGVLAILNRHYQWNLPGVSREGMTKKSLTASELPKLSLADSEDNAVLAVSDAVVVDDD